jgi:imidazolonepropionase-like amidohydrolase
MSFGALDHAAAYLFPARVMVLLEALAAVPSLCGGPVNRPILLVLLAVMGGCVPARSDSTPVAADLALTYVNVVDVASGRVLPQRTVLIGGNRIAAVEPAGSVVIPRGAQVVNARDKYLIPGLWDMHVHVLFEGMDGYLALLVANGVTGIRDMGNSPMPLGDIRRVRGAIGAGDRLGPRFITSGVLVDGPHSKWEDGVALAETPERGRAVVDSLAAAGADFIKVYNFLPPEVYRAIVERATAKQIPVVGHVPILVPAIEASDAGQRSFEHLLGLDQGCSAEEEVLIAISREELEALARGDAAGAGEMEQRWRGRMLATQDPVRCRVLLERLARNGTWQTPTLVNIRTRCVDPTTPAADDRLRYVPGSLREWWADAMREGGDHDSREIQDRCRLRTELVGEMNRTGVPLLAGSDAANPFVVWGFSLHEELALLVAAGLLPLEALQAATLNPARYLKATDSLGTVEAGKLADLVLLDADPLEDIRNSQRISAVVLNGRYLDRRALDRLLAEAEAAANR